MLKMPPIEFPVSLFLIVGIAAAAALALLLFELKRRPR